MKTIKRTLAVLLTLLMLIGAVPLGVMPSAPFEAGAVENPVKIILDEVYSVYPHGSYFTANRSACNHSSTTTCNNCKLATILDSTDCKKIKRYSNGTYNSSTWTCFSFASFCFTQCFGKSYVSSNYTKAKDSNDLFSSRTDFTNQSVAKKKEFFSFGKIGDIIKCFSYDGSYHHKHSMVFISADDTGVTVYDANVGGDSSHTGTVRKAKIKYENIKYYNIELLHANNYESVAGQTTVTVTFNGNGGTPSVSSKTFNIGSIYDTAMPSATRNGYSFDGWYSTADGGTRYGRASTVSPTKTTLYAHWSKNEVCELVTDHVYKIYNKKSGLPLQDNSSGGSVRQMAESGGWNQLWKVTYSDTTGYYQFVSMNNGLAMSMDTGNRYAFGTALQMTAPNGSDTQKFSIIKREDKAGTSGIYSIHSKYSGRVLDVRDASTATGAVLQQWEPHLSDNQLFYFVDVTQSLAPTYATISTSKTTYEVNEPVVFYCNTNGTANKNWIWVLYPDGSNPYYENVGSEFQLSFSTPGHYEAQIVAWNDFGHYDGTAISFEVVNPYDPGSSEQPFDPHPSDSQPSDQQQDGVCPWCGGDHVGFFQKIIGFFHNILAAILGAKY